MLGRFKGQPFCFLCQFSSGTVAKDYEHTVSSSVGWLMLANIQIMLQRIEPANQI